MYLKVIGTELSCGRFTDPKTNKEIIYNNIYLYCLKDNNHIDDNGGGFGFGYTPVSIKIKNSVDKVKSVFRSVLSKDDLEGMVGGYINAFFDDKKQIDSVFPADPPKSENSEKSA